MKQERYTGPAILGEEGRYKILRILGSGTYGWVFECIDQKKNLKVAAKLLKIPNQARKGIPATSVREIGILKSLRHPNIVYLHDLEHSQKSEYLLIFEMMQSDLHRYLNFIKRGQPLPADQIRAIML
jgi:serine/threonine protein kinase